MGISFNEFISGEKIEENNETKLEENLVSSYKESRKSFKQLLTIKRILLIIGIIIILLVSVFLVDAHQMRNGKAVVFSSWRLKYYPYVDMQELQLEKAIKDFIYEEQEEQIVKRELVNAKGFVELNTFYIEANKEGTEYKVSTWVLEEMYCKKDGEIIQECFFSIPYLFVVDYDNDADEYRVVSCSISKDGNRYEQSLKEIFTYSVRKQIEDFDMSNEIKKLIFKIEEKKDNYYGINQ